MALPSGIQTCEVTFGPFTTFRGEPIRGVVEFVPSRSLLWIATGTPVLPKTEAVSLDENGEGYIHLPYTDQPGFADGQGNSVTNWTYRAVFKLQGGVPPIPNVNFLLPSGPDTVDLDLVTPTSGSSGVVVSLPEVLSVNGQTGTVVISGGGGGGPHTHQAVDIEDSNIIGRAVLMAQDAPAIRAIIGAGTGSSNLALGSTSTTATPGDAAVRVTGAQTVAGVKTFSDAPVVPNNSWTIAKTSGLQTALDGKAASIHSHTISGVTGLTAALDAKAASAHGHAQSDITGLSAALAGKANSSHTHAWADVTLPAGDDGQVLTSNGTGSAPSWTTPSVGTGSYAEAIGDGTNSTFVVTHDLGTRDVSVTVRESGSPYQQVFPVIQMTTEDTVTVHFGATVPAADEYRVLIFSPAPAEEPGGGGEDPDGEIPERLDRGFGYTLEQARARAGIARHGLTVDDLIEYTGDAVLPADSTWEGYWFRHPINLRLGGITLRKCLIQFEEPGDGLSGVQMMRWDENESPPAPILIEDCEISGALLSPEDQGWTWGPDGLGSIVGCDIHHLGSGLAVRLTSPANWGIEITSNVIHDLTSVGDGSTDGNHVDGLTFRDFPAAGSREALVRNNWIDCTTENATGAMFIQAWGDVDNVTYENNLFSGGGYCFVLEEHGSSYSGIHVINNRFLPVWGYGPGYREGPEADTWTDNYLYDAGNAPTYAGSPVSF